MRPDTRNRLAQLALIAAVDGLTLRRRALPFVVRAAADETGHLATTSVLISVLEQVRRRPLPASTRAAAALSSVLIDADHVPAQFGGRRWLTRGTPRPYPHAFGSVALAAVIAGRERSRRPGRSRVATGVALGLASHLFRDVGTAPIALAWPLSRRGLRIRYRTYLAGLLAVTAVGAALPARRTGRTGRGAGTGRTARGEVTSVRASEPDPAGVR